ncbi:MAG: HmuY family protein [Spirochaetaceae bacterium]|jgi:hypothetical protein|nr:HmuY family protein [Spirochaetaceae bacterium]
MKHKKFVLWTALILLCALVLGCGNGTTDEGGRAFSVAITNGQKKYFSLSTGTEIPEGQKATTGWDIAFTRYSEGSPPKGVFRLVLTNGGVTATAEGSSGQTKVWYVNTTNFDSVTATTPIPNDAINTTYNTDVTRYVNAAMGGEPDPLERAMNVMTYVGYTNESETNDGTSGEKYFSNSYRYDKKQFYKSGGMGVYIPTYQVYIIQHADGVSRSKIQITYEYQASPPADIYQVRYAPL